MSLLAIGIKYHLENALNDMSAIRDIKSRYKSTAFFLYICVYIMKKCVKIDTLLVFIA